MGLTKFIYILFAILASTEATSENDPPAHILTTCGETFVGNSGLIEYKLNQAYDAGELCSFIIRSNFSVYARFRFVLEESGIAESEQDPIRFTVIGSANNIPYYDFGNLGPPSAIPVITLNGYIAVVTFKTSSASGTGFRLRWKATGDVTQIPGLNNGEDHVFDTEADSPFSLPLASNCAQRDCVDVIVLSAGSKLVTDPAKIFRVDVTGDMAVLCEWSFIEVRSIPLLQNYISEGRVCGGRGAFFLTRGVFIIYFHRVTDMSATGTISWALDSDLDN